MKDNPIETQVLYGLDTIDESLTVEVNLKKLLLVYKTLAELNSFFHQPMHYKEISDVQEYMGDRYSGMYSLIHRIYYKEFEQMLPPDILDLVEDEDFQCPTMQYYKSKRDSTSS